MLEIVIGNRLLDISREVISRIELVNELDVQNFIIVPDRFSLLAEKMIFEELGIISTFNIQVLGISKLAQIILHKNNIKFEILSLNESKILIYNILIENNFNSFKEKSFAVAEEIYKIILQLKSNNINFINFLKSTENNSKLNDIAKIYQKYENELGDRVDQSDLLTKFFETINQRMDYNFFFIQFDSLTEQGGLILEKLILNSKRVVIGATEPNKQKNGFIYDNDVLHKINKICRQNKIIPNRHYILNKTNQIQEHILTNLYGFKPAEKENPNFYIIEESTFENEIRDIAKIINFEVKAGKRFKDFNILVPNLKEKQKNLEKVFLEYKIPYFIDSGIFAIETKPVQFIFSILKFITEYNKENFFKVISDFYSKIDFNKYSELQNYINLRGDFNIEEIITNKNFDEKVKEVAKKLKDISDDFNKSLIVKNYLDLIRKIIKEFEIEQTTQSLISEFQRRKELKLEKIYGQIHNKLNTILEVLEKNLKNNINFNEFIKIFYNFLKNEEIYSIPASIDCVFVGDAVKSFFEERKTLFVVGASQGILPVTIKDYAILSDNDIDSLQKNIVISPTIKMINKRNKFKLFQDLTLAKEKIIISYSSSDSGEKNNPSSLILEFKKIFLKKDKKIIQTNNFFNDIAKDELRNKKSNLDIQNDSDFNSEIINLIFNHELTIGQLKKIFQDFRNNVFNYELFEKFKEFNDNVFVKDAFQILLDERAKEKINNAENLYFPKNKISASQIEKFYECPFKFFFNKGLRLIENKICEFDGKDIGNYFHYITENFVIRNKEKLGLLNDKEIDKELNQILEIIFQDERLNSLKGCSKNRYLIEKLKKEARMLLKAINYEQKWSEFKAILTEKKFNYGINNFKLTGIIDRVDINNKDFRVIDYKSGDINQSLAGVYYGIELQLFIYLLAIQKELDLNPVAGLYLPVGGDFASNRTLKKLILSGFILVEHRIIKKLDKRFSNVNISSDIINLKISGKSDNDNLELDGHKKKNAFSEKGFSSILEYVRKLVEKTIQQISSGKIPASPVKTVSCKNCSYFSICSYKGEKNEKVRMGKELKETDFIRIIEEESNVKKV